MSYTKNCVVCNAPATTWTGHIHSGEDIHFAGHCDIHKDDFPLFKKTFPVKSCIHNFSGCCGEMNVPLVHVAEVSFKNDTELLRSKKYSDG